MKELHNHIFSKTTCISKETMLKYMNKQLLDKEVHDVQKHLIDCEFCSEALEGIKHAENSSVLFSIDHKIDSMVAGKKTPIVKNLLIAATILVLLFGTYFSYLTFNDVITQSESNISMNTAPTNKEMDKLEEIVPLFEETTEGEEAKDLESSKSQPLEEIEEIEVVSIAKEEVLERRNNAAEPMILEDEAPAFVEQDNFVANAEVMDFEEEVEEAESAADEIEMESELKELGQTVTLSKAGNVQSRSENEKLITKVKRPAYKKRDKKKAEAEAPAPIDQNKFYTDDKSKDSYGYLAGGLADEKNLENTVTESSDASTMDFDDVSDGLSESDVSSNSTSNGITLFEAKKYEEALVQFELDLEQHTIDNNKTLWYKALCLIELNRTEEAKTTLKKIVDGDYSAEAKNKLNELR